MAPTTPDSLEGSKPRNLHQLTLEEVLPRHGFFFQEGEKIFDTETESSIVKMALQVFTTHFTERKIDRALAAILREAVTITRSYWVHISYSIEAARMNFIWCDNLPNGLIPRLLGTLIHARELYVRFTHYLGPPPDAGHKEDGELAKTIDDFTGRYPAEKQDERWADADPKLIDYLVDKHIKGEPADWDAFSDCNSECTDSEGSTENPV
ncbi:hypothetical protein AAE478_006523 [Parahypoxylon ruwenzoriense]